MTGARVTVKIVDVRLPATALCLSLVLVFCAPMVCDALDIRVQSNAVSPNETWLNQTWMTMGGPDGFGENRERSHRQKSANHWFRITTIAGEQVKSGEYREYMTDEGIELSPVTRSLLVPGWGQFYQGNMIKGTVFFSISLVSVAMAVHFNGQAGRCYDHYRRETEPELIGHYRRETERYDQKRNQAIMAAVGNHLINLVDILFFRDEQSGIGDHLSLKPPPVDEGNHLHPTGICLTWRLAL